MEKLVVLTGAGISAESGIQTFRDGNGLWENHRIEEVATPEAFSKNPALVLDFYNMRRRQVRRAEPNAAHYALVELEKHYDVSIITQNIDDLHERAGSSNVLHLHGEIKKARSTKNPYLISEIAGDDLNLGDTCRLGSQLRPHIVWFGEAVPMMETAYEIAGNADIFVVVGTSLNVYPAAGLIDYIAPEAPKYLIDPADVRVHNVYNLTVIKEKATTGTAQLLRLLGKH
jgi:NAD-dependent deacetylase